jgi:hypothetical protein
MLRLHPTLAASGTGHPATRLKLFENVLHRALPLMAVAI